MQRKYWITLAILLCLALLTFGVSRASPAVLTLPWFSVDGGGGRASGGSFSLEAAIGQPDAGALSGGGFTLSGGFLQPQAEPQPEVFKIYLPLTRR